MRSCAPCATSTGFVATVRAWSRLFLGVDIARPSPAEAAARLRLPVWLVHSRSDDQIPFSHAERLGAALAGNTRAIVEPVDGPHGALIDELTRLAREQRDILRATRDRFDVFVVRTYELRARLLALGARFTDLIDALDRGHAPPPSGDC